MEWARDDRGFDADTEFAAGIKIASVDKAFRGEMDQRALAIPDRLTSFQIGIMNRCAQMQRRIANIRVGDNACIRTPILVRQIIHIVGEHTSLNPHGSASKFCPNTDAAFKAECICKSGALDKRRVQAGGQFLQ